MPAASLNHRLPPDDDMEVDENVNDAVREMTKKGNGSKLAGKTSSSKDGIAPSSKPNTAPTAHSSKRTSPGELLAMWPAPTSRGLSTDSEDMFLTNASPSLPLHRYT